jgi:hypothetical protein
MRLRILVAISLFVGILAVGCGGGVSRGKVHGKIQYQGKPVASGMVILMGSDNLTYVGDIISDGTYTVDRVPYGPIKVSIQQAPPRPAPRPNPGSQGKGVMSEGKDATRPPPPPAEPKITGPVIPPSYGDPNNSGLKFDMNSADFEWSVDLK